MGFNYGIGISSMVCLAALGMGSCAAIEEEPMPDVNATPTKLELEVPDGFPSPVYMEDNPLTEQGVLLGKTLFFDKSISADGRVSCASCHNPALAFSDGLALGAQGVSGKALERHSPALFNLAWMGNGLFWDGGSKNLESQALGPLTHADEMGMDLAELEYVLSLNPSYTEMFDAAFEDGTTAVNVAKALAQFQRTLVSADSKYDRWMGEASGVRFTDSELKGFALVKKHCASCHSGELFTDNKFHNNGIDEDFSDTSHEMIRLGRYRISHAEADMGAFKTPSLRNSMVTAPYMHDGRFGTMDEVLDHYANQVANTAYTSRLVFQNGEKAGIPLSQEDISAIKDFLHTLTDQDFIGKDYWTDSN
ncbi:cytochrome-c peroxidase [Algoriphagus sp. AGSA1]|uniref:cytochrome-c peroxidase n=1 Tax=Algoriphagus sp. AGSA1 TaxID=2907213 RepID=UPI001F381379|nr:cytochrome c peroxidase [Algoriphagus sp. AGSA1]MCE7057433.1 cytochrome-c peroxidase [Algoriphagus sp. AGSA1]